MGKRILYVEDNPSNMLLVRRLLEAEGHTMLTATDGEGGWEVARAHRPDLILMDLRLAGEMGGIDLTRRIKAEEVLAEIPIVALTAYDDPAMEARAREAGCDAFLSKPADIRQVRAVLHQFLMPAWSGQETAVQYTFI